MQSQDNNTKLFEIRRRTLKHLRKAMGEFRENRWMKEPLLDLANLQTLPIDNRIERIGKLISQVPDYQRREVSGAIVNTLIFDYLLLSISDGAFAKIFEDWDVHVFRPFEEEEMHYEIVNSKGFTSFVEKLCEYYATNFYNKQRVHPFWFLRAIRDYFYTFVDKNDPQRTGEKMICMEIRMILGKLETFMAEYAKYDSEIWPNNPSES